MVVGCWFAVQELIVQTKSNDIKEVEKATAQVHKPHPIDPAARCCRCPTPKHLDRLHQRCLPHSAGALALCSWRRWPPPMTRTPGESPTRRQTLFPFRMHCEDTCSVGASLPVAEESHRWVADPDDAVLLQERAVYQEHMTGLGGLDRFVALSHSESLAVRSPQLGSPPPPSTFPSLLTPSRPL